MTLPTCGSICCSPCCATPDPPAARTGNEASTRRELRRRPLPPETLELPADRIGPSFRLGSALVPMQSLSILFVVGARPNFPKVAPILAALGDLPGVVPRLCHTGQHYDPELSGLFFEDLGIDVPTARLGVGSGSHAEMTAAILTRFDAHLRDVRPDAVVVVGDVNSTLACALAAAKLRIPLAHVEAGLRSGDKSMPEEINRIATDAISDRLYTHCSEAGANLRGEGVAGKVVFVGNVMIDTLLHHRSRSRRPAIAGEPRSYGLVTLHRPALVDHEDRFGPMLEALAEFSERLPLLYPVHPRSADRLRRYGLVDPTPLGSGPAYRGSRLRLCSALRYPEFLGAMDAARLVITDSGGVQEETTVLGVPCLTVRTSTERAVTIREGTNRLVGRTPEDVLAAAVAVLDEPFPTGHRVPRLWDGRAAQRIAADLVRWLRPPLELVAAG